MTLGYVGNGASAKRVWKHPKTGRAGFASVDADAYYVNLHFGKLCSELQVTLVHARFAQV